MKIRSVERVHAKSHVSGFLVAALFLCLSFLPAFIVEEHADGAFTVFVPSVPTPAAGAVYILPKERVHFVDVPFTKAVSVISKWGFGVRDLRDAMKGVANS